MSFDSSLIQNNLPPLCHTVCHGLGEEAAHLACRTSPSRICLLPGATLFLSAPFPVDGRGLQRQQRVLNSLLLIHSLFLIFSRKTDSMSGQEIGVCGREGTEGSGTGSPWKHAFPETSVQGEARAARVQSAHALPRGPVRPAVTLMLSVPVPSTFTPVSSRAARAEGDRPCSPHFAG